MLALFMTAFGYEYKRDLKYRIRRFVIFDIWLYSYIVYGLIHWGFPA